VECVTNSRRAHSRRPDPNCQQRAIVCVCDSRAKVLNLIKPRINLDRGRRSLSPFCWCSSRGNADFCSRWHKIKPRLLGANKSQISHEPNCERGSKKTAPYMGAAMFDLKISPVKMLIYRLLCKQPPRALASCANFVGAGLCFECERALKFPSQNKVSSFSI
jgi:hypothetical protein